MLYLVLSSLDRSLGFPDGLLSECVCVCVCNSHVIRSEVMEKGAECQAVPPGCGEVGDLDSAVILCDLTAPGQQGLASVGLPTKHWARDRTGL